MKYLQACIGVGIFLVILLVGYVAYIKLFRVDVVFYATLFSASLSLAAFALLVFVLPILSKLTRFEKVQLLVICGLLGYVFAITVPTVIDRSLSFYILEKLQQRGGGIQLGKFDYIFTSEYMREHQLVDVRLTEQVESGTITIDGDCVKLTRRGERLASFGRYFRRNLLPKERLLRGEYTDKLTDPFARSDVNPDYLCK